MQQQQIAKQHCVTLLLLVLFRAKWRQEDSQMCTDDDMGILENLIIWNLEDLFTKIAVRTGTAREVLNSWNKGASAIASLLVLKYMCLGIPEGYDMHLITMKCSSRQNDQSCNKVWISCAIQFVRFSETDRCARLSKPRRDTIFDMLRFKKYASSPQNVLLENCCREFTVSKRMSE